jgi:CubicO group peptidase (beta-lactamase class C family)
MPLVVPLLGLLLFSGQTDDLTAATDAIFAAYGSDVPGCAVGVFKDGKTLYAKGYGLARLDTRSAISPRTTFDIRSTSKQFTAVCIALLVEDGKLRWEDRLSKFIPELDTRGRAVTLDHLAYHTSGLMDFTLLHQLQGKSLDVPISFSEVVKTLNSVRRNFEPGAEQSYTNTGYILLAEVVRRVSGQSIATFAHRRLFAPLGMRATRYGTPRTTRPWDAIGYSVVGDKFESREDHGDLFGHAGVNTSIEDLARWDEEFYAHKVISKAALDSLLKPGVLRNGYVTKQGRGLIIGSFRGQPVYRHDGGDDRFAAELVRLPSQHASVAVLANRGDVNPTSLAGAVFVTWFGRLVPPVAPAKPFEPAPEVASRAGFYRERKTRKVWVVQAISSGLSMRSIEEGSAPLQAVSSQRFESVSQPAFNIEFLSSGAVRRIGNETLLLDGMADGEVSEADLQRLVGGYVCRELPISLKVDVFEGRLRSMTPGVTPWIPKQTVSRDHFMSGADSLEVVGPGVLRFTNMRARGLTFVKVGPK